MLTIFTPAYNRGATLPRLYESLLEQTSLDFEWLIVDDGSTDDTGEVVKAFTGEGKFPVRYIRKKNGGKHTAHNLALEEARGELLWCVDSDDLAAPEAVAQILSAAREQDRNVCICSYKTDMEGNLLGGPFPPGITTSGLQELTEGYGCTGEFALAFFTEFAKKYPFPVFEGERFVTESVVYDRMNPEITMLLLPEVTNICEYQAEGYSNNLNRVMKNNPAGYSLYFMQRIDLSGSLKGRILYAGKYWCFRWVASGKAPVYTGKHRLLTGLCAPVGVVFRLYYKLCRGI